MNISYQAAYYGKIYWGIKNNGGKKTKTARVNSPIAHFGFENKKKKKMGASHHRSISPSPMPQST
jgi:hypothetical protein